MARRLALTIAGLAGSLVLAAPALATTYYAAPGASGTVCSQGAPCSLSYAVGTAAGADGDQVVVGPGTYTVSSAISNSHQVSIHGADGQARPVIDGNTSSQVLLLTGGASLRNLEIDQAGGSSAVEVDGTGTIDHVVVNSHGNEYWGVFVNGSYTIRDSVALISSSPGIAASAITTVGPSLTLRNVTAVATGAYSHAITLQNVNTTHVTADAKNVIARGAQFDIYQQASGVSQGNALDIDYSNYRPAETFSDDAVHAVLTDGGHNQTTVDPVFTSDGWHEAPSSPTIGAGAPTDASTPPIDLDGDVYYAGAPDIGADEYLRPGVQVLGQASSTSYPCPTGGLGYADTQWLSGHSPSYTATADGVVTSWTTYVGAVDSTTAAQLDVWHPEPVVPTDNPNGVVRSQSPLETALTPNALNTFTAQPGLAVRAGDSLAIGKPADKSVFCQFDTHDSGDDIAARGGGPEGPQPGQPTSDQGGGGGLRIDVQVRVEPDADHDGYGDLTQDGCPTNASTHGSCPTPSPGNGGTPQQSFAPAPHGPGLTLLDRLLLGDGVSFTLGCSNGPCNGLGTLTASELIRSPGNKVVGLAKRRTKHRTVTIGRTAFSIASGGHKTVTVKLNGNGRKLLKRFKRLPAKLTVTVSGQSKPALTRTVTLKPSKKKHHRRH